MRMHISHHRLAGLAAATASLLAFAPLGAANAADIINTSQAGAETITVNADSPAAITGHTFKALQIGGYDDATGDAKTHTISNVAVSTVSGTVADAATSALRHAKGSTAAIGYKGNPVGEVAAHLLGYKPVTANTNFDESSNAGKPYAGRLRDFVTGLFNDSVAPGFKAYVESNGTASAAVPDGSASTTITVAKPGIYVVEDTTTMDGSVNSIPMLVSTGITVGDDTYTTIDSQPLGTINMKLDVPSVKKSLDTSDGMVNNANAGGELHYRLTGNVPMTTGYQRYLFTMVDRPVNASGAPTPGLALEEGSVKVTIGGKELTKGTDYKITNTTYAAGSEGLSFPSEDDTRFVVFDLSPSIVNQPYNAAITITYTMKVTDNAAANGFANGVSLSYSNDTNHQPVSSTSDPNGTASIASVDDNGNVTNGANGNGSVISTSADADSVVHSYQRSFNLQVVSKTDTTQHLADSQFQVMNGKTPIRFLKISDGSYKMAADQSDPTGPAVQSDERVTTLDVSIDGHLAVSGLGNATYNISQTRESNGYSNRFLPSFSVTTSAKSAAEDATSMYTNTGDIWGLVDAQNTATPVATAIMVRNVTSTAQLPLTGGAGIILFLIVAALLLAIAGCLYTLKRRQEAASANAAATL